MEITAPSLTQWKILKLGSFITYFLKTRTSISIYSTLKLNGVPTTMSITRLNVFTLITFKTSEESLICSDMILNYVRTGRAAHL